MFRQIQTHITNHIIPVLGIDSAITITLSKIGLSKLAITVIILFVGV